MTPELTRLNMRYQYWLTQSGLQALKGDLPKAEASLQWAQSYLAAYEEELERLASLGLVDPFERSLGP